MAKAKLTPQEQADKALADATKAEGRASKARAKLDALPKPVKGQKMSPDVLGARRRAHGVVKRAEALAELARQSAKRADDWARKAAEALAETPSAPEEVQALAETVPTEATEAPLTARVTIGDTIRAAVKARGWTAYRLSKESRVSTDSVARFLKGERDLYLSSVEAVVKSLGITVQTPAD